MYTSASVHLVAECSVCFRRKSVNYFGNIRSMNADMSNKKQCENHCRRKFKGFYARLIHIKLVRPLRFMTKAIING